MEIGITKMSSKGQVVIPLDMRSKFKEGDKIFVIENEGQIILKNKDSMKESVLEDLEFARRTQEAYDSFERGEFISMEADDFFKEIKKW